MLLTQSPVNSPTIYVRLKIPSPNLAMGTRDALWRRFTVLSLRFPNQRSNLGSIKFSGEREFVLLSTVKKKKSRKKANDYRYAFGNEGK